MFKIIFSFCRAIKILHYYLNFAQTGGQYKRCSYKNLPIWCFYCFVLSKKINYFITGVLLLYYFVFKHMAYFIIFTVCKPKSHFLKCCALIMYTSLFFVLVFLNYCKPSFEASDSIPMTFYF